MPPLRMVMNPQQRVRFYFMVFGGFVSFLAMMVCAIYFLAILPTTNQTNADEYAANPACTIETALPVPSKIVASAISATYDSIQTTNVVIPVTASSMSSSQFGRRTGSLAVIPTLTTMLFMFGFFVQHAAAFCECGYNITIPTGPNSTMETFAFTEVIETDFLHLDSIAKDTDWARQSYTMSAAVARGPFGENFTIGNVIENYIADQYNWSGPGLYGGDPGLQFVVDGGIPATGYVPVAQMDSTREDLLWGSYRAGMKLTKVPGTCSAFFWYFNDSMEIDMEILSEQFNYTNNTFPINLVLQSLQSARQGFSLPGRNYIVANLPFDPTDGFHEYRIDFVPGNVVYYADDHILATMNTSAVPTQPGHLILTQWSNGNPLWSYGPPAVNATLTVSYVKGYFNSSDPLRQSALTSRCVPSADGAYCLIPDSEPDVTPGSLLSYFFLNNPNTTNNQTIFQKNGDISRSASSVFLIAILFLTTMFMLFL